MSIGIIGSGSVGGTLGKILAQKGYTVIFGVRDPQSSKVQELIAATGGKVQAATVREAAEQAEIVILTTPWEATQDAIAAAGDLTGKILVDCTNPIAMGMAGLSQGLTIGHSTSAAEEIAKWAPGARVVKAFNNIGANVLENLTFGSQRATAFICGDDLSAKEQVMGLAEAIGFEAIDAGGLTIARLLEPLAMLWIHMAMFQGMGREFAINLVRRS
ncbi:NADPH-dependent F420 reductase [Leptolyngbya sp. 'hensonii']|uniref:NADPH-dependent F420 reductase n=1 Tax=Leptolyngbya sp. 'hensonii' TaxID=1922337 RepID=UPI0009FAFA84